MGSVKGLQVSMEGVQAWRKDADAALKEQSDRLTAVENRKSHTSLVMAKVVTTSRFEAFVNS